MNIPPYISCLSQENYNIELNQNLNDNLSDNGFVIPQIVTANLNLISSSMPDGTFWYSTDGPIPGPIMKVNGIIVPLLTTSDAVTSVTGTVNQIIANPNIDDVILRLADNLILPGFGGVTLPQGTTAQRAGAAGTIRFNTQTNVFESTSNGIVWDTIETSGIAVTSVSGTLGIITCTPNIGAVVVDIDPTYIGQTSITTLGTITSGTWNGSIIDLVHGGTNANLTASNGGIVWSNATQMQILSGTATANQVLLSGNIATPAWSTATYPAITTINQLLYSSSTNTIGGLPTASSAVLITDIGGVPSLGTTLPAVAAGACTCTDPTTLGTASINTALSDVYNAISLATVYETVFSGINNASTFSVTYSPAARTFSVTTTATSKYTVGGVQYSPGAGTVTTAAHAITSQLYFLYYDVGGALTVSSTYWNLLTTAQVALVYYNNSNHGGAANGVLQYELHAGNPYGMANATHLNLHTTRGTQLLSGCVASGYTLSTGGAVNINWTTTAGSIADEDIIWTVASQALGGANTYRILYLTGTSGAPIWNWVDNAESGIYSNGTNIYYNELNAGTWQLTPITSNTRWVNYYIVATTAYNTPQIIVVMGQNLYTSLVNAETGTFGSDCANFKLFTTEGIVLYQVTYRRASAAGAPGNAEIAAFTQIIQNLIITALSAATQAANVSVDTSSFVNFFNASDSNVQQALNDLDAGFPISLAHGGTNANLTANNGGIFYSTASTGAILNGTPTAGQLLLSGSSTTPAWSTSTYPNTNAINTLLYASAANTMNALATGNNGTLITSGTGVPSISSTLPATVQGNITSTGTITSGTWNGSTIVVAYGGTGIATTTPYAVVCAGTTATGPFQVLTNLGVSGQVLASNGAGSLPSWQSFPPPAGYSINVLLVGAGGGGGNNGGGGGGAGGLMQQFNIAVTPGAAFTIIIPAGGAGSTAGSFAQFGNISLAGGGGAGGGGLGGGGSGASGGGGAQSAAGGSFWTGLGNGGGAGGANAAGGGGGAGGVGGAGGAGTTGGTGGVGNTSPYASVYNPSSYYYASGGGGGGFAAGGGGGGAGGGGAGGTGVTPGTAGTANTGGGGGGTWTNTLNGGTGGSGLAIVSYLGAQRGTGGTITTNATFTIHTFTTGGTYTA